jgi:hypothetical protein
MGSTLKKEIFLNVLLFMIAAELVFMSIVTTPQRVFTVFNPCHYLPLDGCMSFNSGFAQGMAIFEMLFLFGLTFIVNYLWFLDARRLGRQLRA